MYKQIFYSTLISLLAILPSVHAQDKDGEKPENPLYSKFDRRKIIDIQYGNASTADYRLRSHDKRYEDGRLSDRQQLDGKLLIPIWKGKKFAASLSGQYFYESAKFNSVQRHAVDFQPLMHNSREEFHYFNTKATFAYFGKLGKRHILYTANLVADGSRGFETINGLFTASLILRQDASTSMSLGMYVTTARSSIIPFFPLLTYKHNLGQSGWTIDALFPSYTYLRRSVGKDGRFSGGFAMDNYTFFVYPGQEGHDKVYSYNRIDLKGDLMYEHFLSKNLQFNANAGFMQCYRGALRKRNSTKDVVKLSQNANFYVNVGFAYLLGR